MYRSLYQPFVFYFTVQTRKILHKLSTFGNVNKQYCNSDVRQLKKSRDVRPLNVDTVVCSLNAVGFTFCTSLLQSFFVWRLYGYRDRTVDDASCCTIPGGRSLNLPACTIVSTQAWTFFVTEASRCVIDECRWCCRNCGTECCVCVNVVPDNVNFTWKFFSHRMQPKLKFTTTYG